MCYFCGDYDERHASFFRFNADFGLLGGKEIIGDIFTSCVDNRAYINITLGDGRYGNDTYVGDREIYYCPICGRELGGGK